MDKLSLQDQDIAVFGGTGFIGRAVVQRLLRSGARVRVPTRRLASALPLKTSGVVGQLVPLNTNFASDEDLRAAISGCRRVLYLPGLLSERGGTFANIHANIPGRLAEIAAQEGVESFVFMSALGASSESAALYAQTKAEGERLVKAAFPAASCLRPSVVFGPGDAFFNRFGRMAMLSPLLPLIGGGTSRLQPVYVGDVADACVETLTNPAYYGGVYALGGPEIVSMREIMERVCTHSDRSRALLPLPWSFALVLANLTALVPFCEPPITRDQIALLQEDNVVPEGALGLNTLGITPTAMDAILPRYMDVWRPHGRYRPAGDLH